MINGDLLKIEKRRYAQGKLSLKVLRVASSREMGYRESGLVLNMCQGESFHIMYCY